MASAYKFIEPLVGQPGVSGTGTFATSAGKAAPLPFGFIAGAIDPTNGYAEFMFVQGASASAPTAGDFCIVNSGGIAGQAVSGNTATHGPVGVAPAAISASNVYGWVQVAGLCDYANLATAGTGAVGAQLYVGTTAGIAQTTAGSTGYVINAAQIAQYSATSQSNSNKTAGGVGVVELYYPVYDGRNQ